MCLAKNFAERISTRKSTVGGIALWSGQFVKAWSTTMGILTLSSGESELAAVLRAATESLGLQSILSGIGFFGHVAIKSVATAAIRMVHRLGLEKSSTFGCGRFVGSASRSFTEKSSLQHVRIGESSDAQTKYFGPEPLLRHANECYWVGWMNPVFYSVVTDCRHFRQRDGLPCRW